MTWGGASAQSLKTILTGVSPPVAATLSVLVQSPSFSLDPYFPVFLLLGLGTLAASLEQLYERKQSKKKAIWLLIGVALSGFVLVSWASYLSALASFIAELVVIVLVVAPLFLARQRLDSYGWKPRYTAYLIFLLPAIFPALWLPLSTPQPLVVVSPADSFPQAQQSYTVADNLTLVSYYSDARDLRVTANSSATIATYLDGVKGGMVNIPFLQQGRQVVHTLSVEVSPRAQNGIYSIALSYQYSDSYGKLYSGTQFVEVGVGVYSTSVGYASVYLGIAVALVAITMAGVLLFRRRR